jgi:hypothetical protein
LSSSRTRATRRTPDGRGSPAPPFTAGDGREAGARRWKGASGHPGTGASPLPPTRRGGEDVDWDWESYWFWKLTSKAEEIRKREPELSEAEAIEKAADLFPEVAQAYNNAIRKAVG